MPPPVLHFTLAQKCLNNIADAAGNWEIEGGQVLDSTKKHVADYSCVVRASCGTRPQQAGTLWMTLLFLAAGHQNVTLHGVQYPDAQATGSVSAAATPVWAPYIGQQFHRNGATLTIA